MQLWTIFYPHPRSRSTRRSSLRKSSRQWAGIPRRGSSRPIRGPEWVATNRTWTIWCRQWTTTKTSKVYSSKKIEWIEWPRPRQRHPRGSSRPRRQLSPGSRSRSRRCPRGSRGVAPSASPPRPISQWRRRRRNPRRVRPRSIPCKMRPNCRGLKMNRRHSRRMFRNRNQSRLRFSQVHSVQLFRPAQPQYRLSHNRTQYLARLCSIRNGS